MARLSKWVEFAWRHGHNGVCAEVTFGKEDGHRIRAGVTAAVDSFEIGVSYAHFLRTCHIGLGFVGIFIDYLKPYRPMVISVGEPETSEAEAQREENERCCFLMEEIEFAVADKSSGELERILALVKESVAADGQPE